VLIGYTGDIYGLLIYDRELSEAERHAVFRNLRAYYALPAIADISLLIGASNAVGIGSGSGIVAPYDGVAPQSYIFAHEDGNSSKPIDWRAYAQANSHVDHPSSSGGLDLSLMHRLADTNTQKQFLIKAAMGGNDLYNDWNPNGDPAFQDGLNLLTSYLTPAISKLVELGFVPRYRSCIIGLGENDASSAAKALTYQSIQAALNAELRSLTASDLLILLVACSTQEPDDTAGRNDGLMQEQASIRSAQANIAALEARTELYQPITVGTLAWNEASPNGIHYDMPTLLQMGIELADQINNAEMPSIALDLAIRFGLYHPDRDYAAYELPQQIAIHHGKLNDDAILSSANPLILWLDANNLASLQLDSSNLVSAWHDQSAHANHALQSDPTQQPTFNATNLNGKPSMLFYNDQLEIADVPALDYSAFSMFVVSQLVSDGGSVDYLLWKWTAPPQLEFILQNYTNGDPDETRFNYSNDGTGVFGISSHGHALSLNNPEILNVEYDGAQIELLIDNISRGIRTGTIHNSTSGMRIGHSTPSVSSISEIVLFNEHLSGTHRTAIIDYLAAKWGITL
jgi:hypothetical protein